LGENKTNLLQGTLDLLILKAIGDAAFHGLGISRRIEQITQGTFRVKPSSLFPALHRLEEAGWLTSFWGDSEFALAAFVAAVIPAQRAASITPMRALRSE
jgi:PadR family transcriptional regulator, regulatory protein PadR